METRLKNFPSDRPTPMKEACANKNCEHDKSSHFKEYVDGRMVASACLYFGCNCRKYMPDDGAKTWPPPRG